MQVLAALLPLARFFVPAPHHRGAAPRHAVHVLPRSGFHGESHPLGLTLHCISGCVWLTHDRDSRDIVLEAGESHTCDRDTRLVVHALEAARIGVAG
jgi:hypothetical protein